MKRRALIRGLSVLPIAAASGLDYLWQRASIQKQLKPVSGYSYADIGVTPIINARGTVTIIGGSRMLPEVQAAMENATKEYVQIDELMNGVAQRLAQITGAERGIVTTGASGAVTMGTAACITGGDPDKLWMLPDLRGMKDEVIIPAYSRSAYDAAARITGAKMVEVNSVDELKFAIGPKTAMILVLAGGRSEKGPLSLAEISGVAKPRNIPILVDAAAEGLTVPNPHLEQGADLVAYSGGKYLRGPQCAGLLIGRADLISAAWVCSGPHHGFGRGYKVGREEIMGMLVAAEMWLKRDHKQEMSEWNTRLQHIALRLKQVRGVKTQINQPRGRSNPSPTMRVEWDFDQIPLTGQDVEQLLWTAERRVAVSGAGSFLPFPPNTRSTISINTSQLNAGEEVIIANAVYNILANPSQVSSKTNTPASVDISGQWNVQLHFSAAIVDQTFVIEQKDSILKGTHFATIGSRKISGTLHGRDVLIHSSYTKQGMRINFEFTGQVDGDEMEGEVSLSEYGMASWKAKRAY